METVHRKEMAHIANQMFDLLAMELFVRRLGLADCVYYVNM
jgi:hypothetical protein